MAESPSLDGFRDKEFMYSLILPLIEEGCNLVKFIDRQIVGPTDTHFIYPKREETAKERYERGATPRLQELPPAAELETDSNITTIYDSARIMKYGEHKIFGEEQMRNDPDTVALNIKDWVYKMVRTIEYNIANTFALGTAPTIPIKEAWNFSERINRDIREMEAAYYDDSLGLESDTLLLHKDDMTNLANYKESLNAATNSLENFKPPSFESGGFKFIRAGTEMKRGTAFGFDSRKIKNVFKIAYQPDANTSVTQAFEGQSDYTPLIRVKIDDTTSKREPGVVDYSLFSKFVVVLTEPKVIQVQKGLWNEKDIEDLLDTEKNSSTKNRK